MKMFANNPVKDDEQFKQKVNIDAHQEHDWHNSLNLYDHLSSIEQQRQESPTSVIKVIDTFFQCKKLQNNTPQRSILKPSHLPNSSQSKRVRFSVADNEDGSQSIVAPSCIYVYENLLTCDSLWMDDSGSTIKDYPSSSNNDSSSPSIKSSLWWTPDEREELQKSAWDESCFLRNECKVMVRSMLHCYKNCKRLQEKQIGVENDDEYRLCHDSLQDWIESEARGLEYTITQKFKQSSQKIVCDVLDYQQTLLENSFRFQEEQFDDNDCEDDNSVTTICSEYFTISQIENDCPYEDGEIAEILAAYSMKLSHRSRIFAQTVALADEEYAKKLLQ